MRIRSAGEKDIGDIANLYVKSHREIYRGLLPDRYFSVLTPAYAEEKWMNYINQFGCKLWVAYEKERFLGFAAGMPDKELTGTWLLDSLHISAEARGNGIGTALIKKNSSYAAAAGFKKMSVCIVRGNERARSIYLKLGAEHYSFFEDSFLGSVSHSEKLIWNKLDYI